MNIAVNYGSATFSSLILSKSVNFLAFVFHLLNENLNPHSVVLLSNNINR